MEGTTYNKDMKGLILSGGKGTRLRPITHTEAKQLIPIANKPVLFYAIEAFVESGITDIGIIVGDTKDEIKQAVGDGRKFGAQVTFIEQEAPLGLAHAVLTAEQFLEKTPFVMYLGDNLIKGGISLFVEQFKKEQPNALILLTPVPNPWDFGVAEISDGKIISLEEKPKKPKSNFALVGVYLFDSTIFDAARSIKPSWRNELEITDAIQAVINKGLVVKSHMVHGWWKDTGKLEDLLEANRLVLETLEPSDFGMLKDSVIDGHVSIGKGAEIIRSRIRGPAIIGGDCRIVDSYIGPFTSVYYNVKIESSEIENSIVLEDASIINVNERIDSSLIGRGAVIKKSNSKPRAFKFMVGDQSLIELT